MNVLILIAGLILLIAGIALSVLGKGTKGLKATLVIIGVLCLILQASFVIIPTGYTGVRTTFGQIDTTTMQNGFNWKMPFVQSIETVNNKQQDIKFKDALWSETAERTSISYNNVTITYQINSEKSAWIYANVTNYKDNLISDSLVSSSIKSASKTQTDTDATSRAVMEPLILENLQDNLNEKYGENVVLVKKVTFDDADFDESYNTAIAEKQKAQLEAEKQAIVNQKNIDKAAADAEVKIKEAEAAAEVKRIEAEAEAEANNKINNSLTSKVLEDKYIEKWNGSLPKVVAGEDTSFMISAAN